MELLVASAIGIMTAAGIYMVLRLRTFPVIIGHFASELCGQRVPLRLRATGAERAARVAGRGRELYRSAAAGAGADGHRDLVRDDGGGGHHGAGLVAQLQWIRWTFRETRRRMLPTRPRGERPREPLDRPARRPARNACRDHRAGRAASSDPQSRVLAGGDAGADNHRGGAFLAWPPTVRSHSISWATGPRPSGSCWWRTGCRR